MTTSGGNSSIGTLCAWVPTGKMGSYAGVLSLTFALFLVYSYNHPSNNVLQQTSREQAIKIGAYDPVFQPSLSKKSTQTGSSNQPITSNISLMTSSKHSLLPSLMSPTHSLDNLKNMSTRELAKMVLSNCKLTQYLPTNTKQKDNKSAPTSPAADSTGEKEAEEKYMRSIERLVSIARQTKEYRWPPVYSRKDDKLYAYCLNTKTGSTFLRKHVLKKGNRQLSHTHIRSSAAESNLVNAFMIIREPMHRMLSAYLNKLKECDHYKGTCGPWTSFARNIATYVKLSGKKSSNLYSKSIGSVEPTKVTFEDFVDYIIHMFLRNDGKIKSPTPDIDTPNWTWWHWESVVMDKCYPCGTVWRDVVLFENLEGHLGQVLPKYPQLFLNTTKLPTIKSSDTSAKVKQYFDQLTDSQIWFLGKVMYNLDYSILPYNFNDFLVSIGREHLVQL
ncbi:uncharacterized protein LOC142353427 isoform X2 [Convolutriloba macropyga]|uniref:uncharacterized protein LOC142353427 isoform X2 n=1 Tax=Convolutriloba macropyga TaxID=536237 RepID=UPI003F51CBFF